MRFFKELFFGFSCYGKALRFSSRHGLWPYYLLPALISLLIFAGVGALAVFFGTQLADQIEAWLGLSQPDSTLKRILNTLLDVLLSLAVGLLYLKLYRYLMLILLSPALALMGEKVQEILLGKENPFDFGQLVKDFMRGIGIALQNLLRELGLSIALLLFGVFVPFVAPLVPIAIVIVEAYFLGFSMIDYRNEVLRIPAGESRKMIWKCKGFAIGNGLAFMLILLIPLLGVLFGPILSVVAAGIGIHELEQEADK